MGRSFHGSLVPRPLQIGSGYLPYIYLYTWLPLSRTGYTDLTYNNIGTLQDEQRPERPVAAVSIFHSAEHRTVALIASAAEEQQMIDERVLRLRQTPLPSVWIADPYSRWFPQEDNLTVYGIRADNRYTNFWVAFPLEDDVADSFPDVGGRCLVNGSKKRWGVGG